MRINLGCGYDYRKGWLNIDSSGKSAADQLMEAHDLDLPDGAAEEIDAAQLVEHLGFFKTKFCLAECWRVLKPGGILRLETPDIDKTFALYLAGGDEGRQKALGWVYGAETPGMNHLYCFPAPLLEELLAEAGFAVKAKEEYEYQTGRPALRYDAVKKTGERAALNSAFRRKLVLNRLDGLGDELQAAAADLVARRALLCGGDRRQALDLALICAPAALEYFELEEENDHRPSPEAAACAKLAEAGLQSLLYAGLEAACAEVFSDAAYQAQAARGRELIEAALRGETPSGARPAGACPVFFTEDCARAHIASRRAMALRAA